MDGETWVVTPRMEKALSGFLHGAAGRLTERQARIGHNGKWHYPSLVGAMREAGLTDVGKSIANRQNTVAQYIATRPLLDLCEGASAREGTRVPLRWWNQTGIDWEAAKARGEGEGGETDSRSGSSTDGEEKRNEEREEEESKASGSSGAEWSGASADGWE